MALHLPIESLKTRSGLEPVPGFEPLRNLVPTSLESDGLTTAPWRPVQTTARNDFKYMSIVHVAR